jgi:hypothetical protein
VGAVARRTETPGSAVGVSPVPAAVPASWLPATGGGVAGRVRRLAEPSRPARRAAHGLALAVCTLAVAAATVVVPLIAITGT